MWLVVGAAGWAVLLLVAGYLSVRNDEPSVREQRDLAQATPVVDRAVGDLLVAAGPEPVRELTGHRLDEGCRITPMRRGATLDSGVIFHTAEADGPALLDRIAQHLPKAYAAGVRSGETGPRLRADAGEFVSVTGEVTDPGVIELTVTTGCRPTADGFDPLAVPPSGSPIDNEPSRLLTALGATEIKSVAGAVAPCAGGPLARTVRSTGQGTLREPLGETLRPLAGADAVVVTETDEVYAYRAGPLSVVVEASDGQLTAAVSTDC